MLSEIQTEAARQIQICNACRYCEGYCSVFPAMFSKRNHEVADLTQLANLCHNCRGCYYACQYTEPHEFALNLPAILAETRSESWERFAWPSGFARLFQRSSMGLVLLMVVLIAVFMLLINHTGDGFYSHLSHAAMIAIFIPSFFLPLLAVGVGLRRYWSEVQGAQVRLSHITQACANAATLRNLSGGQAKGCNFEAEDRYTNARKHAHQALLWGFVMCFASTSSATLMHYLLGWEAPYSLFSLPKLLGLPGGILVSFGAFALVYLKLKADKNLGDARAWNAEMAFTLLIGLTGLTGLLLYAATGTAMVSGLLAIHLGCVLAFFVTMPYSKMAHGFYRFAALVRDAQISPSK